MVLFKRTQWDIITIHSKRGTRPDTYQDMITILSTRAA